MTPDQEPIIKTCFVCKRRFQHGPHLYEGRMIRGWGELICDRCIKINHDGIVPASYPHVVPALRGKGINPKLNANGFIMIPL